MKVLVTGGAGFLGSHLVDRLVVQGHDVTVIDNYWTGTRQFENEWATYTAMDVSTVRTSSRLYDRIYHLASPASPDKYMADPVATMRANFVGALNILPALKIGGRFCFTSTSEVYGDPDRNRLPETYKGSVSCTGPRSSYDESKRATEALLHELHRTEGLDIRCARIFNAYGPRTQPDDGRAVSNFIAAGLRREPIRIYGSGNQTRCFTYVDCIIEGLMQYFNSDKPGMPTVMNIGCDREATVAQIAHYVAEILKVPVAYGPPAPDDPQMRRPDLTRARQWLPDWDPHEVTYEEGIARTIRHFQEVHKL